MPDHPVAAMAPQIRSARSDDYPRVAQLTVAAYLPGLRFGTDDPYLETLEDAAGRASAAELLVATEHDDIVGTMALCRPGTAFAEIARDDELEVRMLAVAPSLQSTGIGKALMAHALNVAEAEGFSAVALSVVDTNSRGAGFYRSLGYHRCPERDWTPVPGIRLLVWRRAL